MLTIENTVLLVIDVQGKLAQLMDEKESLFKNLQTMIKGAAVLKVPVLWMEQNPKGLGGTIPELAQILSNTKPIEKTCFSCCKNMEFVQELEKLNRKQVLITGIETHICVYQTAADLLCRGYEVEIVIDAVSSRTKENKAVGIQKMRDKGVGITCIEMALYELLKTSDEPAFKDILNLVK